MCKVGELASPPHQHTTIYNILCHVVRKSRELWISVVCVGRIEQNRKQRHGVSNTLSMFKRDGIFAARGNMEHELFSVARLCDYLRGSAPATMRVTLSPTVACWSSGGVLGVVAALMCMRNMRINPILMQMQFSK